MRKSKEQKKFKEPVRLRFKQLANGNQSIYLDYYENGRREYEFLKKYLIPNPPVVEHKKEVQKDGTIKIVPVTQNDKILDAAIAIKSQRVIELANGAAGIKQAKKCDVKLTDFLNEHYESLSNLSENTRKLTKIMIDRIVSYIDSDKIKLRDVDRDFCRGFIDYLISGGSKYNLTLTKRSADIYYTRFVVAMNDAVRRGYIKENPTHKLSLSEKIKPENSTRTYLTIEEVQRLIKTDCKWDNIKRAFLFSCFCGLRISDIRALRWGDIEVTNRGARVAIIQQKTKENLYLNLSAEAVSWLPPRRKNGDKVFNMGCNSMISRNVSSWANDAGINKHVTFHTARHTFATMILTLGADLYTVSKLLGHTSIQTTQIYAKIIDQKKQDAVELVDGIFKH